MEIQDKRSNKQQRLQFHQLEHGEWVEGCETKKIYFVVTLEGRPRLVSAKAASIVAETQHTGDFVRLHNVTLTIDG